MPELPEVETIARLLREGEHSGSNSLIGCEISSAQVLWQRTLAGINPEDFSNKITGQFIQSVSRRGKFLLISLTCDTLLIHLRMSGDLRVESIYGEGGTLRSIQKHDRLVLNFTNEIRLAFHDTRKFGQVWLVSDPEEILGTLGPEPLDPQLTPEDFYAMLHERGRQLKPLLMDQSFLAGLGNIYTDEALHLARIHPLKQSNQLSGEEADRLLNAIRSVLQEGIHRNGASIDWVYRGGEFQNHFRVYGRTGEPCPVCDTPIQRLLVGQCGTHICPKCQPTP